MASANLPLLFPKLAKRFGNTACAPKLRFLLAPKHPWRGPSPGLLIHYETELHGFSGPSWRNLRKRAHRPSVRANRTRRGLSAKSDAADVNFSHYAKQSQSESRPFREGLSRSAAVLRIGDPNFAHYAKPSPSNAPHFRQAMLRFPAALRIGKANFAHYAMRSQSEWRHFRESVLPGRLRRCPAPLRPARIRRSGCSHGPVGRLRVTRPTRSELHSTAAGLIHPSDPQGRGYNRLRIRRAGHPLANANLPIGDFRRAWPAPFPGEATSAQRSSPARQPRSIPQVGRKRREWSRFQPTLPFHNPYWKSVSTAFSRVPPTTVPRSTGPKSAKSPFFRAGKGSGRRGLTPIMLTAAVLPGEPVLYPALGSG
jgi:hypothetical protein